MREFASKADRSRLAVLMFCVAMTVLTAIVPVGRAFYRVEINYNEGWNIYNAATVAAHGWLYPAKYGWTTNNYPMLSFVAMAGLHRLTHEYLFTARMVSLLSLLCGGWLAGGIVYRLRGARAATGDGGAWLPAVLAAMFTVALFCANADTYVGMDDPQMLAQVFFLAGLYVYVGPGGKSTLGLAGVALLFVVGGFIKHNPVDFPLAVLLDLLLLSRWRAAWFAGFGLALAGVGLALNVHYGGPHFLDALLAPRSWALGRATMQLRDVLGPLLLPLVVAGYAAVRVFRDQHRRVAGIFLMVSLLTGGYFAGGQGVSVNALFSAMLAMAVLVGLFLDDLSARSRSTGLAVALFAWLAIPLVISGNWNAVTVLREAAAGEAPFAAEVSAIAAQPGPALCESLLRCYAAGKPYVYDPFNAMRLVELGKLDQTEFVAAIRARRFGAIQLDVDADDAAAIERVDPALRERFTPEMLAAIRERYVGLMRNADGVVYVPGR